ncbi:MAG: glycosyltransferase [Alphaproteobacteria bacterium]|nr:glycosyltransferase [Alphaproteobacteria bacterium]
MNILLLTIGSRGDVQPYVALGKGLKAAGHHVTVATCSRFRPFVEAEGLSYGHISDDILKIIDSDQGKALMEDTRGIVRIIAANIRMARQIAPIQHQLVAESWAVARDLQPDLVCFHPKAFLGSAIGEKLGIPAILTSPIPLLVPTGTRPCLGFPKLGLGRRYNRATYWIVHRMIKIFGGAYIRKWRRDTNTPARRHNLDCLRDQDGHPLAALHAYSSHVVPRPDDWPDTAVVSGYWFLDGDEGWVPPDDLVAFLDAGPPPIYIGFGSMAGRNPKRLANLVIEALKRSGQRGILASGWGGLDADEVPESVHLIDQAPHAWLFPKVAAVVHHGGAGTTAAGLRAGRPTLICPFIADQPFWGETVRALGAGPAPIVQRKLSVENLTEAFGQLVDDTDMHSAADAIGKKVSAEDGIGNAVSFIERLAAKNRP